jgi:hypothetical protein
MQDYDLHREIMLCHGQNCIPCSDQGAYGLGEEISTTAEGERPTAVASSGEGAEAVEIANRCVFHYRNH